MTLDTVPSVSIGSLSLAPHSISQGYLDHFVSSGHYLSNILTKCIIIYRHTSLDQCVMIMSYMNSKHGLTA